MVEYLKKIKLWQAVLGVFITITSVYTSAAAIGLNIPRFVWVAELQAAERKIDVIQLRMERLQLDNLRRSWSSVVSRIAELEAKGIKVPNSLVIMENQLRDDLQNQKNYIRQLERK